MCLSSQTMLVCFFLNEKKSCFKKTNGVKYFTRITIYQILLRGKRTEGRQHLRSTDSFLGLTKCTDFHLRSFLNSNLKIPLQ